MTKGLEWPGDFAKRTSGAFAFVYPDLLPDVACPRVLDVGAGPISKLGNLVNGKPIHLRACDPLALVYSALAEKAGVTPYTPTEYALSERLCDRYQHNFFDMVHMSNALDHAIYPVYGLCSMLSVCKIEGTVILNHKENEAECAEYDGLHQWNISEDSGDLICWNKEGVLNFTKILGDSVSISVERRRDHNASIATIFAKIIKKKNILFDSTAMNFYDQVMAQAAFYLYSPTFRELSAACNP